MEKLSLYLNPRLVAADFTQILRAPRDYQGVSLFKSKNKTWWVIRTQEEGFSLNLKRLPSGYFYSSERPLQIIIVVDNPVRSCSPSLYLGTQLI